MTVIQIKTILNICVEELQGPALQLGRVVGDVAELQWNHPDGCDDLPALPASRQGTLPGDVRPIEEKKA